MKYNMLTSFWFLDTKIWFLSLENQGSLLSVIKVNCLHNNISREGILKICVFQWLGRYIHELLKNIQKSIFLVKETLFNMSFDYFIIKGSAAVIA